VSIRVHSRLNVGLVWLFVSTAAFAANPKLPGVAEAIQKAVDAHEITGGTTAVVTKDKLVDLEAVGFADIATQKPMQPDSIFWIKSMTKPVTAVAVMMLQDDGKLNINDLVAKYIPAFADLKTPSGKAANLTLKHLLPHTSGLGEGHGESGPRGTRTLAELVPHFLATPMLFEPGERWKYCQAGINTMSRIVEIVSGKSFDQFCAERIFGPLAMNDTTFYPTEAQLPRVVTVYRKNKETGALEAEAPRADILSHDRPPLGNSGLYSTAPDFARFAQMLLNNGTLNGHHYLKPETVKLMASNQTGDLKAGFVPGSVWGLAVGIMAEPQGVTEAFSPGTWGHGGAYGTQVWIDPMRSIGYVLMIQRSTFGTPGYRNGDDTVVRHDFQGAVAAALK
jgi:CubicO group peptidase (beta-lactamase class C family)